MQGRCFPGQLRRIYRFLKSRACACTRELAANGLINTHQRYDDIVLLGQGGFGTVHRGRCKKTRKEYAIKTSKAVSC